MPKVVIIGAGPIGLLTAVQIQLYHPELTILMYEKYEEYRRKHTLQVNASSFKGAHPGLEFQKIISAYSGNVPTNKIEQELKQFAMGLGIKIIYEEIKDVKATLAEHTDAFLCIGADGSHSVVRDQLFDNTDAPYQNLQYLLEFKAQIKGKQDNEHIKHLSWYESAYALSLASRYIQEKVGAFDEKTGLTPYTLRMFVSEAEFAAIRGPQNDRGTFKNPLTIDILGKIDPNLSKQFQVWLDYRHTVQPFSVVKGDVSTTNLPAYTSNDYVIQHNNMYVALAGDAPLGIPFFQSFNAGAEGCIQLAQVVDRYLRDKCSDFNEYENSMRAIAAREIFRANIKAKIIKMADTSVQSLQFSSAVSRDVSNVTGSMITYSYEAAGASVAKVARKVPESSSSSGCVIS